MGSSSAGDWSLAHTTAASPPENIAPAQRAFEEGLRVFKHQMTKDPRKRLCADQLQASSIQDVLDTLALARQHYEDGHSRSKASKCLSAFSKRLCFYGRIMDVMVQTHPEYVALVWGAMKLLFGAVVENDRVGTTIVTALCDIADALPRMNLATSLYPTAEMQHTVALLYAHIVRFLIRALDWYKEGKLAHALHSITRPAFLRYDDLVKEIQRHTQSINNLAISSSQAEQRDMHKEIRTIQNTVDSFAIQTQDEHKHVRDQLSALTDSIVQLKESVEREQALNIGARIALRHTLADAQLVQALALVSTHCKIDHKSIFRNCISLRDRYRHKIRLQDGSFSKTKALQDWNSSSVSSSISFQGTIRERAYIRDLCADIIEQLVNKRVPVLWLLKEGGGEFSLPEAMKSLILQALSADHSSHTDVAFSFQLRKFLDAQLIEDYVSLFLGIVEHFEVVYIIADTRVFPSDVGKQCPVCIQRMAQLLTQHAAPTKMKVVCTLFGASLPEYLGGVIPIESKANPRRSKTSAKYSKDRSRRKPI